MKDVEEVEEVKEVKEVKENARQKGPIRTYHDLLIYQQAKQLAHEVSELTKTFPRQEQWELGRQLRDSSRSVAANIVEGWAKRSFPAEFKRHLMISYGECAETHFWIEFARDEGCTDHEKCEPMRKRYSQLGMMIYKLWREWRKLG